MTETNLRQQLDKSFKRDFWKYFIFHPIKAVKSLYLVYRSEDYKALMSLAKVMKEIQEIEEKK